VFQVKKQADRSTIERASVEALLAIQCEHAWLNTATISEYGGEGGAAHELCLCRLGALIIL